MPWRQHSYHTVRNPLLEPASKWHGFAPQFRTKVASDFERKRVGDYGLVYDYFILIEC